MENLNWSTRNPVAMVVLVVFIALLGLLSLVICGRSMSGKSCSADAAR